MNNPEIQISMTIGIGCDIVEHTTTKRLHWDSDTEVLQRLFSQQELNLYEAKKTISFLAGRFAAKEAILKCIGTGMQDEISLIEIQILQGDFSKPNVVLSGKAKAISDELGIDFWHLSITHSENYSVAMAIAETRKI